MQAEGTAREKPTRSILGTAGRPVPGMKWSEDGEKDPFRELVGKGCDHIGPDWLQEDFGFYAA